MKKSFYLIIFILSLFISFNSCTLTTEEDSGSLSITLPSLTMSRSGETIQCFSQLPSEYEITIGLKRSEGYVYSGIHKTSENPIVINKIKPDHYVITITGHTDTHLYTDEKEIDIKSGKNEVTLNLEAHKKEILGYYVNSKASMEGNGTKTYPFKTIDYALKNIPQSKTDVTLFLNGTFTERIFVDDTSFINNLKITKDPESSSRPLILSTETTTDERPIVPSAVVMVKENGTISFDNVDFESTDRIMGIDEGYDRALINVVLGSLTITNSNISIALINNNPDNPEPEPSCAEIYVSHRAHLNLGGNLNFSKESGIILEQNYNTGVISPINVVSDITSTYPINIAPYADFTPPYPQIITSLEGVSLAKNSKNFNFQNLSGEPVEFIIDDSGKLVKTKIGLSVVIDEPFEKIEIKHDNKSYVMESKSSSGDIQNLRPNQKIEVRNNYENCLFDIGKTYTFTIILSSRDKGPITQEHVITIKDGENNLSSNTIYANTNTSWYVSNDPNNSRDNFDGFKENPFATISRAIEVIKKASNNATCKDKSIKNHTINVLFKGSQTIESTLPYDIDFPCNIKIVPQSNMGVPILKNVTTSVFNIDNVDANVSLSSMTIQGDAQNLTNSGLINLQKGSLELINCATDGIGATMNGVNVMNGTTFTLTGSDNQGTITYNGNYKCPININEGAIININFATAQTPIGVLVPVSNKYWETPLFKAQADTLTREQMAAFNVNDSSGAKYMIYPKGTVGTSN